MLAVTWRLNDHVTFSYTLVSFTFCRPFCFCCGLFWSFSRVLMQPVSKLPGVSIWRKHAADTLRMSKAEAIVPNSSVPSPSKTNSTTSKKSKIGGLGVIHSQDAENSCPSSLFSCPTLGPGVAGASLAARPLSSPALSAVADGASNKRNMDQITEQKRLAMFVIDLPKMRCCHFHRKKLLPKKHSCT